VGPGIFLVVVGAILAFAVRGDTNFVDIQVVGLILILGGVAAIWHARRGRTVERNVTQVDDATDPERQVHTVRESRTEQDPDY
jgi:uncharacterized membrane protein HdeD (DUF308 family)